MCIKLCGCCRKPPWSFRTDLADIEKDERYFNVPRIVVECAKFIEQYENVTTPGVYQSYAFTNAEKQWKFLKYQVIGCHRQKIESHFD